MNSSAINMNNQPWNLESFVDALVVELDKTRETLAVKAINKPLSYTVKDMNIDLQIFPTYDGDKVKFLTAQPGESGSSKVSLQLASITDQQVRATSKKLSTKDDIDIEQIDVDDETKKDLRKMGITSVNDLEEVEKRNVDVSKVVSKKTDYKNLANIIQKARRATMPPKVNSASINMENDAPVLLIEGSNLSIDKKFEPVAIMNSDLAKVLEHTSKFIKIKMDPSFKENEANELVLTLDPFSIFKLNVKGK